MEYSVLYLRTAAYWCSTGRTVLFGVDHVFLSGRPPQRVVRSPTGKHNTTSRRRLRRTNPEDEISRHRDTASVAAADDDDDDDDVDDSTIPA